MLPSPLGSADTLLKKWLSNAQFLEVGSVKRSKTSRVSCRENSIPVFWRRFAVDDKPTFFRSCIARRPSAGVIWLLWWGRR